MSHKLRSSALVSVAGRGVNPVFSLGGGMLMKLLGAVDMLGVSEGALVGVAVGSLVGASVGDSTGLGVGEFVGEGVVGVATGEGVGLRVGRGVDTGCSAGCSTGDTGPSGATPPCGQLNSAGGALLS
jgi:hypothetical protein